MSNRIRHVLIALHLLVSVAASGGMQNDASAEEKEKTVNVAEGPVSRDKSRQDAKAKDGERRLRCWQYGRLIFESHGIAAFDRKNANPDLQIRNGATDIQVFDLQQALCIIDPGKASS